MDKRSPEMSQELLQLAGYMTSMFKREQLVDHIGAYRTQSLFIETNSTDSEALMTLKEVDWLYHGKMYPSFRRLYMEIADPEEYQTAIQIFGSWEHWKKLLRNKKIRLKIEQYREELEISIRSGAVKSLINTAHNEGSKGTTAAKYIAEKGWAKRKAGAPSKEEVTRETKILTGVTDEIEEDLKRLGITH